MANLLPPNGLKRARGFYRSRLIFTGSVMAIVCACIAILSLLPVYVIVSGADVPEDKDAEATLQESADREDIAQARLLLKALQPTATTSISVLSIWQEIISARPAGTFITSLSLKRGEDGEIVIGGASLSREDVNSFREALSRNPRFRSVNLPLSALVGASGAPFDITLRGTF